MTLDKTLLSDNCFVLKKSADLDTSQQDRVFEKKPHGIAQLDKLDFCSFDNKALTSTINKAVDSMGEVSLSEDIYLTIASSQIYNFLLNMVKVPTLDAGGGESCVIRVCQLKLKNKISYSRDRNLLNFLGLLNLDLDRSCVLMDSVYGYLTQFHADLIEVITLEEIPIACKRIVMDRIENNLDVLSVSFQKKYRLMAHSILSYRLLNNDAQNNIMMDNLQSHLIDQQLRFSIYLALKPLLVSLFIRFNRQKNLVDATGNLFFRLSIPQHPIYKNQSLGFRDILLNILDYGFFISYPNLVDRIAFQSDGSLPVNIQKSVEYTERFHLSQLLGENIFYTVLFRLMDVSLGKHQATIDDLIISRDFEALQKLLTKIIG
ncbi:hypothetical protein [Pedobacter sp.]|uniref:hypothetical protein n=1 Tax=Pedobacter sp. TaxID=1411316 RepID=UPI003D7FD0EB